MTQSIEPLHNRIVIKQLKNDKSIVLLSNIDKDEPQIGTVISVGPGKIYESGIQIKPALACGDLVIFGKYHDTKIKLNDEEYTIMREDNIFGKLQGT